MLQKTKLKNGKYYIGDFRRGFADKKGWFLGSFFEKDNPLKTYQIEICYKEHIKDDRVEPHYHKKKVEVLLFLTGRAKYTINGRKHLLKGGNFLFVDVNNVIEGKFLKPSKIIAIHSPSLPKDKISL